MKKTFSLFLVLSYSLVNGPLASAEKLSFTKKEGNYEVESYWDNKANDFTSNITFTPAPSSSCKSFGFIQSKRVHDANNNDYIWTKKSGLNKLNFLKTKDNWFLNHSPNKCLKGTSCSPFVENWSAQPQEIRTVTMSDLNNSEDTCGQVEVETCLVCKETNKTLSCIQYTQVVSPEKKVIIAALDNPSSFFSDSLSYFQSFYKK